MTFVFLLIVFAVCVGFTWNEGMWSNGIMLINVLVAATLATNYFEPVADYLESWMGSYTYLLDFLSLWFLFAVILLVLRLLTDLMCRQRVKFKVPVEHAGRVILSICIGWVMVQFTCMTLHTAPLAEMPLRGSFQSTPMASNFLFLAPDRQWLAFMQSRSRGALSRSDKNATSPFKEDAGRRVFDPRSEFIIKYAARRMKFEKELSYRVQR